MSGIVPLLSKPVKGTKVGTLAVGSSVYLMENGVRTEFLVVNRGNPDASLYDSSCDGCWLLMKDVYGSGGKKVFRPSNVGGSADYSTSTIAAYLTSDEFMNGWDNVALSLVKQIKIPYWNSSAGKIKSGTDGFPCKFFSVAAYELGGAEVDTAGDPTHYPKDGKKLEYFNIVVGNSAQRIAQYNNANVIYWTRSTYMDNTDYAEIVNTSGGIGNGDAGQDNYIRPALILPSTALIDDTGLLIG